MHPDFAREKCDLAIRREVRNMKFGEERSADSDDVLQMKNFVYQIRSRSTLFLRIHRSFVLINTSTTQLRRHKSLSRNDAGKYGLSLADCSHCTMAVIPSHSCISAVVHHECFCRMSCADFVQTAAETELHSDHAQPSLAATRGSPDWSIPACGFLLALFTFVASVVTEVSQ